MDWTAGIDRHRDALKRVLAGLVGMAGLRRPPLSCRTSLPQGERSAGFTLPRHLHRAILRLLRPAEAAARRLIIVAARNLAPPPALRATSPVNGGGYALRPAATRDPPLRSGGGVADGDGGGGHTPAYPTWIALPLTDPLPRWRPMGRPFRPRATGVPRISVPGFTTPHPVPPPRSPDDPVDAMRLAQRLAAVAAVLDDLPHHARRFLRWQARNQAAIRDWQAGTTGRFRRFSALRPGRPPGHPSARQRRAPHEVHDLLADMQYFAREALEPPDTS